MKWALPLFCFLIATARGDLLEAVHQEATERVATLLAEGVDPNATNRYGIAPLSLACENGQAEMVAALLAAGADPNVTRYDGETALMIAARTGRLGPVEQLLAAEARVSATDGSGQTALMWAAAGGYAPVVSALIQAGADPNRATPDGFTPLFFAARSGHTPVCDALLEAGVEVDVAVTANRRGKAPPRGTTALRFAVENAHFETAIALLEAGADPNDLRSGRAPIHQLAWVRKPPRGDGDDGLPPPRGSGSLTTLDFLRRLITDFGADPDLSLPNGGRGIPNGATAFYIAAKNADLDFLQALAELRADPSIPNADNTTPLMAACGIGSAAPEEEAGTEPEALETIKWLLARGDAGGVNDVNNRNETPMHGAALKNFPKVVALLAEQGADIDVWNRKNKRRETPLLIAQGFRPGNFKPSAATEAAIAKVMRDAGVEPPPAPER